MNTALYSQTFVGTKRAVDRLFEEVRAAVQTGRTRSSSSSAFSLVVEVDSVCCFCPCFRCMCVPPTPLPCARPIVIQIEAGLAFLMNATPADVTEWRDASATPTAKGAPKAAQAVEQTPRRRSARGAAAHAAQPAPFEAEAKAEGGAEVGACRTRTKATAKARTPGGGSRGGGDSSDGINSSSSSSSSGGGGGGGGGGGSVNSTCGGCGDGGGTDGGAAWLEFVEARRRFVKGAKRSFGNTALLLSGGATLGHYHIGVLKALGSRGHFPTVICGTSAVK